MYAYFQTRTTECPESSVTQTLTLEDGHLEKDTDFGAQSMDALIRSLSPYIPYVRESASVS